MPLFFGRLDYDTSLGRRARRDPLHRPPPRHRRDRRRADGDRLAGADVAALLPGPARRADGRPDRAAGSASPHGALTAYEDEDLTSGRRRVRAGVGDPRVRDRATADRPDARHRGHHPAGAGPDRPGPAEPTRSASRAPPAPARPRSGCTVPPTCCTPTATSWPGPGVLVVGPNDSFLSYIGDVLPALGEIDATQATVSSLVTAATGAEIRGLDLVPAALIKGDARMAEVLRRAVWGHVGRPTEALVVPRGAYQWRVGGYLAAEIVDELTQRGVRYEAGPDDAAAAARPPGAAPDGGGRRLPRRPGAERRRPQHAREDVRGRCSGPRSTRPSWCSGCSPTPSSWPPPRPGSSPRKNRQLIMMAKPARSVALGALVAGRRDLDRRDRGPDQPDAESGPRDPRRGAGPLAHAAARGRAAGQHRLGHRARRSGAGHHPVGDLVLGGVDDPSRPPGRRGGGAGRRLPGAGRGDRLRRPAAAHGSPRT